MKPFPGASQAADWMDGNCVGCRKRAAVGGSCIIEQALTHPSFEETGEVPEVVAQLMGAEQSAGEFWPCHARQPLGDQTSTSS